MPGNEELIAAKEAYRKILMQQYTGLYEQLSGNLDAAAKVNIKSQIDQKQKEVASISVEIDELKQAVAPKNESYNAYKLHWEEHFPKINFSKSRKIIERVLKPFHDRRGEALFLLQKSRSMKGDLCIQLLTSSLKALGTWRPPVVFEFLPHQSTDPLDFLNTLANQFEVTPEPAKPLLAQVIEAISNSLQSGDVLLIQVGIYWINPADNSFVKWFVDQFWQPLINQLGQVEQNKPFIRVVAVLSVRDKVPNGYLSEDLYCTDRNFAPQKIVNLPLQDWKEAEIRTWLFKFSKLMTSEIELTRTDIETMAKTIYQVSSRGKPNEVYDELMDVMTRKVS